MILMVDDIAKLNALLVSAENEQSSALRFEFVVEIVNQYFIDFFYVTNIDRLNILVEQSLSYYFSNNLNDKKIEVGLLLLQTAVKFAMYDFKQALKNLKKCKQLIQIFDVGIYHVHYQIKMGFFYLAKKFFTEALSKFKKALSILEEIENDFNSNAKLYLDTYSNMFSCYFLLGDYELAFNSYYKTIELGEKHQIYEAVAKATANFYGYCYFAGADKQAAEAITLTRQINKKTNSNIVKLFSSITEINKNYFENKYDNVERLLEKYKKTLLSPKIAYFSSYFLYQKIHINLYKENYTNAFKYSIQLSKLIKSKYNPYFYYLLLTICKICTIDEKYLKLVSKIPVYQKYGIDNNIENLFKICIKCVNKQPKRDKINLYNFIINFYKKAGFNKNGLEILTDCINELQKITSDSVKNELVNVKLKYDITKKVEQTTVLLEKQKKRTKFFKEFAYTAAHDLKAPLINITEFARIIKNSYNDMPFENAYEYLDIILETSETMSKFINELIKYKRNDNEGLAKVYLADILRQVKINLYKDIENSNCTIQILNGDFAFFARRTPLEILFQNFISNAIKYKRKGVNPIVKINITKNTKEIISISDNGIGIPKEMQKKIFDPFFQIPNKNKVGNGIGLATCKKIVESLGGEIWLQSTLNKGTTFYFTL